LQNARRTLHLAFSPGSHPGKVSRMAAARGGVRKIFKLIREDEQSSPAKKESASSVDKNLRAGLPKLYGDFLKEIGAGEYRFARIF
jgi:hypothetical protein